ncbi:S1C family serine protease [Mariniblastus fucicola]|uniref:Serine endoprotease n=1 Tax=Mariniblastus fucicola TaxID=980251 RepID=A0A5B9PE92_9BACT|nr:S1C family serine protease [Mariniblastus fucicola]QEG23515.1 serine endoprotease [Mariniblastus fucicola]
MKLSPKNLSTSVRFATALTVLFFFAPIRCEGQTATNKNETGSESETEDLKESSDEKASTQTKRTISPYPVVVLERDANFSIPNASAKPAALRKTVTAEPFLPKEIYQRTAQPILDATELIAEGFQQSVVEVRLQDERVALGTVVSSAGHVVTKHSLISDTPFDQIHIHANDQMWSASIVGVDQANDLALLSLRSDELMPKETLRAIAFTDSQRMATGKLVIGVGTDSQSLAVGMTTAPPTAKAMERDCETCIDMGLTLSPSLQLTRVYPRTVGERLGLLVGDRLISINRKPVLNQAQFDRLEQSIQVGDLISIAFQRNGQASEITAKVPELTKISKRDRWGGGPFSKRRSGFGDVIVHDSVVDPLDCGGPLVDLQGKFCGINIARSMRVASLAIPADSVQSFLLEHLDESELILE